MARILVVDDGSPILEWLRDPLMEERHAFSGHRTKRATSSAKAVTPRNMIDGARRHVRVGSTSV